MYNMAENNMAENNMAENNMAENNMAENNAKKNVIDTLEKLSNAIKRMQNALRHNDEEPKLEVKETSTRHPLCREQWGKY